MKRNGHKIGNVADTSSDENKSKYCFALESMMLALKRSQIDYFSLNMEGKEMEVLRMIPFDKLDIKTLSVNFAQANNPQQYVNFMKDKGYEMQSVIEVPTSEISFGCKAYIFVKS